MMTIMPTPIPENEDGNSILKPIYNDSAILRCRTVALQNDRAKQIRTGWLRNEISTEGGWWNN